MLLTLCSSHLWSQQDSAKALNNALLFEVGSNFTLRSFEGQLVSFKRMISESKSWRLGISLSGGHTEGEDLVLEDTLFVKKNDDRSVASLTVVVSFQHYRSPAKPLRFYYGYGLTAGFDHQWNKPGRSFDGDRLQFGVVGQLGVEWFFHENFSLSGEYGAVLSYRYYWRDYLQTDEVTIITVENHSVDFRPSYVRLGLSAFF